MKSKLIRSRFSHKNTNTTYGFFERQLQPILISWLESNREVEAYLSGETVRGFLQLKSREIMIDKNYRICFTSLDAPFAFADCIGKNNDLTITDREDFPEFHTVVLEGYSSAYPFNIFSLELTVPRASDTSTEIATLKEDAMNMLFYCNALYLKVGTGNYKLIDPTGKGINDLRKKIIRSIKDPVALFKEDPLKMIKAIRFKSILSNYEETAEIEEETLKAIQYIPEYDNIELWRFKKEICDILTTDQKPSIAIRLLHERGLLKRIFPDLEESWGFNQNSRYHSLNLTDHLLSVLDQCRDGVATRRGDNKIICILLAALLHDISKYYSYQVKEDGSFSFKGHEFESAIRADVLLDRLGFTEDTIKRVHLLIENHMILKHMWDKETQHLRATDKTILRVVKKLRELNIYRDELILINSDNRAHAAEWCMYNQVEELSTRVEGLHRKSLNIPLSQFEKNLKQIMPDGNQIMKLFKIEKSGKVVGEILNMLDELYWYQPKGESELTQENLLEIYKLQFNETICIDKTSERLFPYLIDENGEVMDKYDYFGSINDKEIIKRIFTDRIGVISEGEEKKDDFGFKTTRIFISALYYPNLYLELKAKYRIISAMRKARDLFSDLMDIPGIESLKVEMTDDDFSGFTKFDKWKPILLC